LLAGRPGEAEKGLRAAGVDAFVFAGQDAIAVLEELHKALATA
jgi:methylmalonyl-CoA mutase